MVQCIATFMEAIYVARRNAISAAALRRFHDSVDRFLELRDIFIVAGVRDSISLPRQHALLHYYHSIQLFGSPNGLCSSITESKHIKAVKEPWRRSNRYKALIQMLCTILRLEKMATLRRMLNGLGLLKGTTSSYMASTVCEDLEEVLSELSDADNTLVDDEDSDDEDGGPVDGTPSNAQSDVKLASRIRMYMVIAHFM